MLKVCYRILPRNSKLIQVSRIKFSKFVPPEKPKEEPDYLSKYEPHFFDNLIAQDQKKKLKFEDVKKCLCILEEKHFPLPEELSKKHWEQLLKFQTFQGRALYIESIWYQKEDEQLEDIYEFDNFPNLPPQVEKEVLEKFLESKKTYKNRWDNVLYIYEKMQLQGVQLWPFLNVKNVQDLLSFDNDEQIASELISNTEVSQMNKFIDKLKVKRNKLIKNDPQKYINVKKVLLKDADQATHHLIGFKRKTSMKTFEQLRVAQEYNEWGQPLVIDMSWYSQMNSKNRRIIFGQFSAANLANRCAPQPFQIHYTSANEDMPEMSNVFSKSDITNFTEEPFWKCFPPERLVYLTNDSKNELKYSEDDIYVIGGLFDIPALPNATLSLAKSKNVRHARLPKERFIGLPGILRIQTIIGILADYRATGDWFYAYRWLPSDHYLHRLKRRRFTFKEEYTYFAHKALQPMYFYDSNGILGPVEYRQKYEEILSQAPKSRTLQNPDKYLLSKRQLENFSDLA